MPDYSKLNEGLPSAFQTDYEGLKTAKIKAAFLNSSDQAGGLLSAHTWTTFITNDNRVIIARGGPLHEPVASSFGSAVGKRTIGAEGNESFGRLVAFMGYVAEKSNGANARSDVEDFSIARKSGVLDTVNYKNIRSGQGMDGFEPLGNIRPKLITNDPAIAQTLFNSALDVTAEVNRRAPEFRMVPSSGKLPLMKMLTGLKRAVFQAIGMNIDNIWASGGNSHSVTSWIMQKGDDTLAAKGGKREFMDKLSKFLSFQIVPGSSVSRVVGTGLPNVESLKSEPSYKPVEATGVKYPPAKLMNYSRPDETHPASGGKYNAILPVIGVAGMTIAAVLSQTGKTLAATGNSIDAVGAKVADQTASEIQGALGVLSAPMGGARVPDSYVSKFADAVIGEINQVVGHGGSPATVVKDSETPEVQVASAGTSRPLVKPKVAPPISQ